MAVSTISPGRQFFDKHLETIAAGKIDEMVDRDYAEDAVLITFFNGFENTPAPITIRGRENIKKFFHDYLRTIEYIDIKSLDFTEAENAIFFQAKFNCKLGLVSVGDAWTIRNGQIAYHFGFWAS
ncbi:MAG: nuclear transport factor 2 family protein [Nostoc sp. ChiSLP01]|nr:nuclear transport factor 2 family protein [Nostoc sp. CmiSLP01]MDZ8282103.1 nuclear transport factor 2 family protein [Nostoc sp. ChiSLP01]